MSFHLYDIIELYSNADGSVQFIELRVGNVDGESMWQGKAITVSQDSGTSTGGGGGYGGPGPSPSGNHVFTFPKNLPSMATANTSVLIATRGFADLGIATPDFIVPSGFLFKNGGTVDFAGADSVTYGALPTDGIHSLNRGGATVINSPKNYAGASGTVPGNPIVGTNGADNLKGTAAGDYIVGKLGNDIIAGGAGSDTLKGGPGNDTYVVNSAGDKVLEEAAAGTDLIRTTATLTSLAANVENARLMGAAALDINANALNNVIFTNAGSNVIDGGPGTDTVSYQFGATSGVTVSLLSTGAQATGGSGSDTLVNVETLIGSNFADNLAGNSGNNTLNGLGGADIISGGAGADKLKGGAGGDSLDGGAGDDTIVGGGGSDFLVGGSGDDMLKGGGGSDTLNGGDGADVLVFNKILGPSNHDTMVDFTTGEDVIHLDADIFQDLSTAPTSVLNAAEYTASADGAATQADDRIIYNTLTGDLFYDSDGIGPDAPVLFATLDGAPTLAADDFLVVG